MFCIYRENYHGKSSALIKPHILPGITRFIESKYKDCFWLALTFITLPDCSNRSFLYHERKKEALAQM
jgi:hypothetical protein